MFHKRLGHVNIIPLFLAGTIDDALSYLPDIEREHYTKLLNEVLCVRQKIFQYVDDALTIAPKESRKEFADWVEKNCHKALRGFVFAKYLGCEIEPLVLRGLPRKYIDFMEFANVV